ncbi:MAG: hypothetical protein HZR80_19050 [Candidatus Heimdallarchaeota archaeon]
MLRRARNQSAKNTYLCGLIDGEGSFSISIKPHNTTRFGWVIDPTFSVTLEQEAEHVLRALQQALTCGRIITKPGQPNCKLFLEESRRNIAEKIIPFFERYPLEIKTKSFKHFKEVVERLENKEHREAETFLRLAVYAFSHKEHKGTRKYTIEDILETMKKKPENAEEIVRKEMEKIARKKQDSRT